MRGASKPKITFISAGAGSGKTYQLTEILYAELSAMNIRPAGVIATTFTRKAATELRERVRSALLEKGEFALASAMGQARIGTVNGVCGQLIERFIFEAGLAPDLQIIEEVQATALLERAIDAVMGGPARARLLEIARRLGLDDDWQSQLRELVDQARANDIAVERLIDFAPMNASDMLRHFPKATSQELSAELLAKIREAIPSMVRAAEQKPKKVTREYLELAQRMERGLGAELAAWSDWVKLSKAFPEAGLRSVAEPIGRLAGRFAEHPRLHADLREYLDQLFGLAGRVIDVFAQMKRELGVIDFVDQEHLLLRLLDRPGVAAVLDEDLDLLMVDEFQDTSPIQLALFLKLARHAKRVFWVGDVKQAIYGFRGSDTELMLAILDALPALDGTKEVLPKSWRSRPHLVHLVNEVFAPAFSNSLAASEVQLEPTRQESLSEPAFARWELEGKTFTERSAALAAGIARLMAMGYRVCARATAEPHALLFSDIAVLARSHQHAQEIGAALRARNIPVAMSQPGLLCTAEAVLALACLRRLNDPGDTVASAEIVSLAESLEPETWVADRLRYLRAGHDGDTWLEVTVGAHAAHPMLVRLAELRREALLFAPREALQTAIVACGLPEIAVRWSNDAADARTRLTNLEALLDLATQYEDRCREGQHAASLSGLLIWLSEMAREKLDALAAPAVDAVKVLTHHAAKGLEWPVVILTDLDAKVRDRLWSISAQSDEHFSTQEPLKNRYLRFWPWPFGRLQAVSIAEEISRTSLAEQFRRSAVEEAKRLLYVSMTRARDLVVFAGSGAEGAGNWLDCIDAPWLQEQLYSDQLVLPSGRRIPALHWELKADESAAEPEGSVALHWYSSPPPSDMRAPLNYRPSSACGTSASLVEQQRFGHPMTIGAGAEPTTIGNAIHACFAASFADEDAPLTLHEVQRMLAAFRLTDQIDAGELLAQVHGLHRWLATRWPSAMRQAEYPVQCVMENGQVMNGRIDLLLDTPKGYVLIDHKSGGADGNLSNEAVFAYAAQLAAYSYAVERATGGRVTEMWLSLPGAGRAVRLL